MREKNVVKNDEEVGVNGITDEGRGDDPYSFLGFDAQRLLATSYFEGSPRSYKKQVKA